MDAKLKHLEFIQNTINRMAKNSFLLKGWSVTIVGGLLALSFKEMEYTYILISLAVLFFFWILDGYYLSQERSFIKLYNHVRKLPETEVDFAMDASRFRGEASWSVCAFSRTMRLFYGGLVVVHLLLILIL